MSEYGVIIVGGGHAGAEAAADEDSRSNSSTEEGPTISKVLILATWNAAEATA